ncbi:MAG: hypothetical protein ACRCW1_02955 [Anaerotignaceae bacterium]
MTNEELENMKSALEMFYEVNGYENFYEEQLKTRTPEQIVELYHETFGETLI